MSMSQKAEKLREELQFCHAFLTRLNRDLRAEWPGADPEQLGQLLEAAQALNVALDAIEGAMETLTRVPAAGGRNG